ncbi:MAG: tetratricopeptide repeat protein, partial [Pseudomonadota bacterium]
LISILGVTDALKEGRLTEALERLDLAGDGVMPLVADLWRGWIFVNMGEEAAAFDAFAAMTDNDTTELFARYHAGLAHVAMGEDAAAAAFLTDHPQSVSGLNAGASLAQVLLLDRLDRTDEAVAVLDGFLATSIGEEGLRRVADALRTDEPVPDRVIERPTQGFARVLYDVASVLGADNSDVALLYLRLALYLDPDMWDGWLLTADILEQQEQIDLALDAYGAIPPGVVQSINAQLGRASVLEAAERVPEALEVYAGLVARHPSSLQIRYLQAQTLRRAERYEAAIAAYGVAIELAEARDILFWQLLNGRAVTHHLAEDWPSAEADFRAALALAPNQPFVLNYLGYSLVERNEHLDEALDMIERAVEQRPNSGFIVDSLGWVYFILERFEEAVPVLERAVALEPVDPVINDHLGDAYWMAGRKREAEFQWHRALSFDPEPEDRARILRKLDVGLYEVRAAEAAERETLQEARNVD